MCGIITIVENSKNNTKSANIGEMLFSLSKRGPDEKGSINIENTTLGQTRLSVVDINGGHQPMRDNSKQLTIVFNGEIYDYKELTKTLKEKGHIFSTNSDTEVILKAYIEYGIDCPKYLDGMFAFAIWDDEKKELFIARDRFGKKPFYYTWINDMFLGSSEIKALFASGLVKGKVDPIAIDNYLQLSYIPPWKTVYSNIHTLQPAHACIVKNGKIKNWQYWQLKNNPSEISYEEAKKIIKDLLNNAVKKRTVADVEIGSLLSGGVDSTIITAYTQKYTKQQVKTFSVGYEGYINELPFAKQASEKIGTEHYTLQTKSELINELEKVVDYLDEPHADSSNLSQYLISGLASSKVKVVMSGDGADELFMGYGWYWKYWNTNKLIRLKNFFFSNQFKEYLKHTAIFSKKDRLNLLIDKSLLSDDIEKKCTNKNTWLNRTKQINIFDLTTYLPGQLLVKIDRMSMVHGLEVRSPFLDYKLAEFVYNLPTEFKMNKNGGKIILKDILLEIMPKEFVYRRKQGFGAPVKEWLQTESVKSFIKKTLSEDTQLYKFLKKEEVLNIFDTSYKKNDDKAQYKLWSIFCLALWFKHHQKYHE
ncbi:MAG: asparagine synthase (glutamine-hydrolyzing) [Candidatus Paceibacterota bacterium]|jgi:asparagine synthase (glutamine-hydrolysing)